MFRFIVPITLIAVSIAGFLTFTSPTYQAISSLRAQIASYDEALGNSKALENEKDKLTKKYNAINPDDLVKILKFLPDSVDNIRLILEIEKVATPYNMTLRDVKYDNLAKSTNGAVTSGVVVTTNNDTSQGRSYGTWNLGFSVTGTYADFMNFLHDLESNLRVVDVASIEFSSDVGPGLTPSLGDKYKFSFNIKTYWLKN